MFISLVVALATAPAPRLVGEPWELKTETGILYGTLDLPSTPAPWPVVIFHAGSGPTDRDGNGPLVQTNCMKQLGRALAAEGIAVLRIDKRGIAASRKSLAKEEDVRLETYANDLAAWIVKLRNDSRFTKLAIMGHSEGALIGLIALAETKPDAFVSLCGPGRPLQDILREQLKKNLPEKLYRQSDAIITELTAGRTVKEIPKGLEALFRPSVQPYIISMFRYDPARLLAAYKGPILVMSGSTDIQVAAVDAKKLGEANPSAKVITIDGMNHVLKLVKSTIRIAQLPSYADPSLPLHPKLAPEVATFLKQSLAGK